MVSYGRHAEAVEHISSREGRYDNCTLYSIIRHHNRVKFSAYGEPRAYGEQRQLQIPLVLACDVSEAGIGAVMAHKLPRERSDQLIIMGSR